MENSKDCCKKCEGNVSTAYVCWDPNCECHTTKQIHIGGGKQYGKFSLAMHGFIAACKAGKSIIYAMPEGNVYSEKAHQDAVTAAYKEGAEDMKKAAIDKLEYHLTYDEDSSTMYFESKSTRRVAEGKLVDDFDEFLKALDEITL